MLIPAGDRTADRVLAQHRRTAPLNAEVATPKPRRLPPALALILAASLTLQTAWAEETCRYSGTTDYAGRVSVETRSTQANGETTVNVAARVNARTFGIIDWQYLYQEIGVWRDGTLWTVGVNHRYSLAGSIRRQQWDLFRRTPEGMTAWRVQAKTLADFRAKHPGFVRHWDPATFGEAWLDDYAAAPPERRADLDLPKASMPPDLGTPLLMAFFWVRWSGPRERTVPLFLPGFKRDARVDARVVSLGVGPDGLLHLRTSVTHPQLSETKVSTGDAWISPDNHLVRVTFDARADHASAHGELRLDGCEGAAIAP
jgi:hypothetical protein